MKGRRVHISGSASLNAESELLATAHEFVRKLSHRLVDRGYGLVLGIGDEPIGVGGLPCTFDWTVLEEIAAAPGSNPEWPTDRPARFRVVASQRALDRIPESRLAMWDTCTRRADVELQLSPPGWRMGGVIRELQVLSGDVLVTIGGGAGVEHLASLYSDDGKSVIPIHCDLGAIVDDGNGGSSYLHRHALSETSSFLELRSDAGSATNRLASLRINVESDASAVAEGAISLIGNLRPPIAFFVRLLATELDDFEPVEEFFRKVVDPVITANGFTPYEVGRHRSLSAFTNVEVFERLHRASLVVADLTGVRPNCTMELGYALARRRRVVITAMQGTKLPFDSDKLPTHFWSPEQPVEDRLEAFQIWLEHHIDMPPLVR